MQAAKYCKSCETLVLPSDVYCWKCGIELSKNKEQASKPSSKWSGDAKQVEKPPPKKEKEDENDEEEHEEDYEEEDEDFVPDPVRLPSPQSMRSRSKDMLGPPKGFRRPFRPPSMKPPVPSPVPTSNFAERKKMYRPSRLTTNCQSPTPPTPPKKKVSFSSNKPKEKTQPFVEDDRTIVTAVFNKDNKLVPSSYR